MNTDFTENAWEEFEHWLENDYEMAGKIRDLIKVIKKTF